MSVKKKTQLLSEHRNDLYGLLDEGTELFFSYMEDPVPDHNLEE
jgi:hypothetical protein